MSVVAWCVRDGVVWCVRGGVVRWWLCCGVVGVIVVLFFVYVSFNFVIFLCE